MSSELSDEEPASPTSMPSSDIIKSVPRSQFPILVSDKGPQPFDLRAQNRVMRWRCRPYSLDSDPVWMIEPDLGLIKDVAQTYLERCGFSSKDTTIEFFAEGAYHKLYTINTTSMQTGLSAQCIFRVFMPEYPWYKIESEVATTEYVRHTTSIPVPITYAYDSSTDNKLGLEWMLVEKIPGASLLDTWADMANDAQLSLTKQLAQWFHQLALNTFDQIGSLYMQLTETEMEFYVGPTIDYNMYQGNRLAYNIYRGPFHCLEDYYDSILAVQQRDISDPVYQADSPPWDVEDEKPDSAVGGDDAWRDMFEEDPDHKLYGRYGERIGFTKSDLEHTPKAIQALRDNLAALVEEPDTGTLSTMLSHPDLSFSNILADSSGKVNALIDWEGVILQPPFLMTQYPLCLKSQERDYDAIMKDIEHNPNREELLRINIDAMVLTRQRKVFRAELEELKSPYLRVFEEESEYQEELYKRIWNRSLNQAQIPRWVEVQLEVDDDTDDESDDDEEGTSTTEISIEVGEMENIKENVEVDEMEDIKMDIEGDDNRLAEEMSRVEKDMTKTEAAKFNGSSSCEYCGHSPQRSLVWKLLSWFTRLPRMLWTSGLSFFSRLHRMFWMRGIR